MLERKGFFAKRLFNVLLLFILIFQLISAMSPQIASATPTYMSQVNVSPAPVQMVAGESVTITATVTSKYPSGGAPTPTGTVTLTNGSELSIPATLSGGIAHITTSQLVAGGITITYSGDANFLSSQVSFIAVVNKASTTTSASATPNPSTAGQPVTLTATVTAVAPATGTPSGSVMFTGPNGWSQTVNLVDGVASLTTTTLATGVIAVNYLGTTGFYGSVAVVSVTVNPAPASTTTVVSATPDPSVLGEPVTVTATVAAVPPGSGTPTGTVTFSDSNGLNQTVNMVGGAASLTASTLATGTITATYNGDSSFAGSMGTAGVTVNPADTSTTVTAAPDPSVTGEPVTVTATVAAVPPGSGTPTGTVTFSDSNGLNQTVNLVGGIASLTASTLATGTITATYNGDSSFAGSMGTGGVTVNPADTSTTVTAVPDPSVTGESVTVTATVAAVPAGSGTPSGTVTFSDSNGLNQTVNLVGGAASLTASTLATGTITATYNGGSGFAGSMGTTGVTVNPADTTTTVTVVPDPSVSGQSVTVTATVAAVPPGLGTPSGTVTFAGPGGLNQTVALDATGKASVTTTILTAGTITATYNGGANYSASTGTVEVTVNQASTTTEVTATPDPSVTGESVTVTATVAAVPPGSGTPSGTVTFAGPGGLNQTVALDATGKASVTTTILTAGTITATYNGGANYSASTGTVEVTVNQASTTTEVTATPDPSVTGESVTVTATVAAVPPGSGTPSGTVTFAGPGGLNQTVALDATGKASVTTTALTSGTVTATYDGDTNYSVSTGTTTVTVTAAPAVTGVSVSPKTANVVQGGTEQLTATVTTVGGAAQTVTWTSGDASNKVTVDADGLVSVAGDAATGAYTITATSTVDGTKSDVATITVTAVSTFSIEAIDNQTAATLIQGYAPGTQELKTIPVLNTGTGALTNLNVSLSGTGASAFDMTQPPVTTLNSGAPATSFTVKAKNGLPAGTYTATITVMADHLANVSFDIVQVVNLPNVPANPQNLAALGGDRQVTLNWSTVTEATYYNLYMSTTSGQFGNAPAATVTEATYRLGNLTNGTAYYFVVKAGNPGGWSAASNEASAIPATVPAAPTNVTATAGDGLAVIAFTAPSDNGGSPITGYEVTSSPGNIIANGTAGPITVTGLSNETTYTFTVRAINRVGKGAASTPSNPVTPSEPTSDDDSGDDNGSGNTGSGGGGGGGVSDTPAAPSDGSPSSPPASNPVETPGTPDTGVEVLVNGKVENAGTANTATVNDQTVTTITIDPQKLEDRLSAEGQGAVITIPVNSTSDVVVGQLNGQMVQNMENQQAVVEIKTDNATYTLPAQQINIGAISDQLGQNVNLQDIKVQIEISKPSEDMVKIVENSAVQGEFTIVAPPLDFTVSGSYGDTTIDVSNFNAYVERTIAIPDGVDPSKITTGVVIDPDGTVRHVPTKVEEVEGKYYAKINSLTNSTYSVVWHPVEFADVAQHWAKDAVNDMGSRMVIDGTGNGLFNPDQEITRAEFAAVMVRGLGLKLENGATSFADVKVTDWYCSIIQTANSYHLIDGFEDGTFRPNDKITREQAMIIIAKAAKITGLKASLSSQDATEWLSSYVDAGDASEWAVASIADCLQAGIVSGRDSAQLAPQESITRAEVAAIVQRLLQKSGFIQ